MYLIDLRLLGLYKVSKINCYPRVGVASTHTAEQSKTSELVLNCLTLTKDDNAPPKRL
jgi:hypothetical protein